MRHADIRGTDTRPAGGSQGRLYVVGAHIPNGGTYMAYHLGRIICDEWGYEFVAVEVDAERESHAVWSYEPPNRKVSLPEMIQQAGRNDVLICNPSFSGLMLGLSFPGSKLMYVQDVKTFEIIDGFFDKYVAVSPFVAAFVRRTYGMRLPVIAPFIHHDHLPQPLPTWEDRPEGSVLVGVKVYGEQFLDHFTSMLNARHPGVTFSPTHLPPNTPHPEVLRMMSGHRYFLWLSAIEGFGLPPLEAMLCGTAVVGFHGCGGSYFRNRKNALACGYPDFPRLADLFAGLLLDDALAMKLVRRGRRTAAGYTFEKFRKAWIRELAPWLDRL